MNLRLTIAAITASLLLLAVVILAETRKGNTDNGASSRRLDLGSNGRGQDGNAGADLHLAAVAASTPVCQVAERVVPDAAPAVPRYSGAIHAGGRNESVPISLLSLLGALRQAESTGRDSAVGDGGAARGPYQIHRDYWREAVAGTDAAGWDYDTWVWDRDRAGYVVFLHWSKVCPTALRAGFVELLVRCHRLPYAPWRKDNDAYWRKVKKEIEFD